MSKALFIFAVALGLLIAYIDTRPNWDDTGVIALALVVSCAVLGALSPERPWLWALAVGCWIPAFNIALSGNLGSIIALAFAFAGAYAGMAVRKTLVPAKQL
jgi:uncharacterized membrane protein